MADNKNLTPKQARAIAALLTERTVEQAARAAGVGSRTLARWLTEAAFLAELRKAEAETINAAARTLTAGTETALNTLHGLMTGAESEAVRRLAASEWLELALKMREVTELEQRITALETQTKGG